MLLLFLCVRSEVKPLVHGNKVSLKEPRSLRRHVASLNQQCLKDSFTKETLQREVQELEGRFEGERLEGRWRHLDYSELPLPQATFLHFYGPKLGDLSGKSSGDISHCKDLPCVLNTFYGESEERAGYVHYLWFLKFGHLLALDNEVPKQRSLAPGEFDGKARAFKDYLWSQDELYGFWRLSHMLRTPYTSLGDVKEIQRLPRGAKLEEARFREACALSSSAGWTKLGDKCLLVKSDKDLGHFYPTIVHELAHHIDYREGRELFESTHRSIQDDYVKLAGFTLKEYRDERGFLHRSWQKKKDIKLPSAYAGASPQENFAEVMAYARVDGDLLSQKVSKAHRTFVSNNYYGGESFEKKALIERWLRRLSPLIMKRKIQCKSKTCVNDLEEELRGRVMLQEPEGCLVLADKALKAHWKKRLGEVYTSAPKALGEELLRREIAFNAYLKCVDEKLPRRCYEKELDSLYLKLHPFEDVEVETVKFYRDLVRTRASELKSRAEDLWAQCKSQKDNDEDIPSGTLFTISEGHMASGQYNCLNKGLEVLLRKTVADFSPSHSKEDQFLTREILGHYQRFLFILVERDN